MHETQIRFNHTGRLSDHAPSKMSFQAAPDVRPTGRLDHAVHRIEGAISNLQEMASGAERLADNLAGPVPENAAKTEGNTQSAPDSIASHLEWQAARLEATLERLSYALTRLHQL